MVMFAYNIIYCHVNKKSDMVAMNTIEKWRARIDPITL